MPAIKVQISVTEKYEMGDDIDWLELYSGVYFTGNVYLSIHKLLDHLNNCYKKGEGKDGTSQSNGSDREAADRD